jgi:NO-binding membrane sensor protein with MHYT domain
MKLWDPASREAKFIGLVVGVPVSVVGIASAIVLLWIERGNDLLFSIGIGVGISVLVFVGGVMASVARDGKYEFRDNLISAVVVGVIFIALSLFLIVMVRIADVVEAYYRSREAVP